MSRALSITGVLCAALCAVPAGCNWPPPEYDISIARVDLEAMTYEDDVASVRLPTRFMATVATSPDGKHMVIWTPAEAVFLDAAGKVLQRVSSDERDRALMHPVFSPDSQRVVFFALYPQAVDDKFDDEARPRLAAALVSFSPQGKELSRTVLPDTSYYAHTMSTWTDWRKNR